MDDLTRLERDYEKCKEIGARPALLRKLEDRIGRLKNEQVIDTEALSSQELQTLFNQACDELNALWIEGTMPFITNTYPELMGEISESEKQLNLVWVACIKGQATKEAFNDALGQWVRLQMRQAELYRAAQRGTRDKEESQLPIIKTASMGQ